MSLKEILIIVFVVALCVFAFYLVCQTKLREKIYAMLLDAEKTDEDGQTKMEYVVYQAYDYVPTYLKIFISGSSFKELCQKCYDYLRDLSKDGKLNGEK